MENPMRACTTHGKEHTTRCNECRVRLREFMLQPEEYSIIMDDTYLEVEDELA